MLGTENAINSIPGYQQLVDVDARDSSDAARRRAVQIGTTAGVASLVPLGIADSLSDVLPKGFRARVGRAAALAIPATAAGAYLSDSLLPDEKKKDPVVAGLTAGLGTAGVALGAQAASRLAGGKGIDPRSFRRLIGVTAPAVATGAAANAYLRRKESSQYLRPYISNPVHYDGAAVPDYLHPSDPAYGEQGSSTPGRRDRTGRFVVDHRSPRLRKKHSSSSEESQRPATWKRYLPEALAAGSGLALYAPTTAVAGMFGANKNISRGIGAAVGMLGSAHSIKAVRDFSKDYGAPSRKIGLTDIPDAAAEVLVPAAVGVSAVKSMGKNVNYKPLLTELATVGVGSLMNRGAFAAASARREAEMRGEPW